MGANYEVNEDGDTIWPEHYARLVKECGELCLPQLYHLEEIFSLQVTLCEIEDKQELHGVLNVISEAIEQHSKSETAIVPSLVVAKENSQLWFPRPGTHQLPLAS